MTSVVVPSPLLDQDFDFLHKGVEDLRVEERVAELAAEAIDREMSCHSHHAYLLVTSWAPDALKIGNLFDRIRGEAYWQASLALGASLPEGVRHSMVPNA